MGIDDKFLQRAFIHSFPKMTMTVTITVGVLALQGGFHEHLTLLRRAVSQLSTTKFALVEVRTSQQLAQCDALIIPGGERCLQTTDTRAHSRLHGESVM